MYTDGKLLIGKGDGEAFLLPSMANRHGLIAGATGTGKTVTLKVMAESFSDAGVPVFLADIKGDLAGMIFPGESSGSAGERLRSMGISGFRFSAFPTRFWDVLGESGHRLRTTMSEMGPGLLSRVLGLNGTQTGVLNAVFRIADENGLLLLDIKDLRSMLGYAADNAKELSARYGNITSRSVSAIVRSLLALEDAGGGSFFGEPSFDVKDFLGTSYDGKGYINVLHCRRLFQSPNLYSAFMLWLLSELYECLPERGDLEKPKAVFFFDEAHLLFDDAGKALRDKIEQVVRLIRSKGVGVYFITQSPSDIPGDILGQLGNKIQHALRAYTPAEMKKVKAAADSFRPNPAFDTAREITNLATGQAIVSFLDWDGVPGIAQKVMILPPQSRMGAITPGERRASMAGSGLSGKYDIRIDRESAYEILRRRAESRRRQKREEEEEKLARKEEAAKRKEAEKRRAARRKAARKEEAAKRKEAEKQRAARRKATRKEEAARLKEAEKREKARKKQLERFATNAANSVTRTVLNNTVKRKNSKDRSLFEKTLNSAFNTTVSTVGRQTTTDLVRGILGNLLK